MGLKVKIYWEHKDKSDNGDGSHNGDSQNSSTKTKKPKPYNPLKEQRQLRKQLKKEGLKLTDWVDEETGRGLTNVGILS